MQVALKLLMCWQGVVVNSQDLVKPYIHGLLPPVVRVLLLPPSHGRCMAAQQPCTNRPTLYSLTKCSLPCPQVERLGDNKQDVRQAACDLLLDILQVGGWLVRGSHPIQPGRLHESHVKLTARDTGTCAPGVLTGFLSCWCCGAGPAC